MKLPFRARALACAAALALAPLAAHAQIAPIVSAAANAPVDVSSSATTELIVGSTNMVTYVTFAHIEANGTGTIQFKYGAVGCTSLVAAYGGAISLTAQTGFAAGAGVGPVMVVPKGKSLCLVTVGAVQYSGWLVQAQLAG